MFDDTNTLETGWKQNATETETYECSGFDKRSTDPNEYAPVSLQDHQTKEQQENTRLLQKAKDYTAQKVIRYLSKEHNFHSIPYLIRENALNSRLRAPQQRELARVETFLFYKYIGKIKQKDSRLGRRTFQKLIDKQLSAGKWQIVKESQRFPGEQHWNNLSPVYMLSPAYLKEIIEADKTEGHYSSIRAREHQAPAVTLPAVGIPSDVGSWLNSGRITWKPETVLSILSEPEHYLLSGATNKSTWLSAVKGWQRLAPFTASNALCPSWNADNRVNWIYSSKPCLQGVPAVVRRNALEINGSVLAEADYRACQLNMVNHEIGVGIIPDPLKDLQLNLEYSHGIVLSRGELKQALYPLFQGRTRYIFDRYARDELSLNKTQVNILWETLKPYRTGSGIELMKKMGSILLRALEIMQRWNMVPVIPIFDAVATRNPEEAREALHQASIEILYTDQGILADKDPIPVHIELGNSRAFAL